MSITHQDNYPIYQESYNSSRLVKEDLNEVNEEAITRFFLFQENGLFSWESFCNELEYE
jgi:hypothetical protein